jgi:hypothetical protein
MADAEPAATPRAAQRAARTVADVVGATLAMHAPVSADDVECVRAYLADGGNLHVPDSAGWRLLHVAARSNAVGVAELLLVRGAARTSSAAVAHVQRAHAVRSCAAR